MRKFLGKFARNHRGIALLEFAIVFPFLFLLLFGGIEVARYILILQKLEKSVYTLTDIVGQAAPATAAGAGSELNVTQLEAIMNSFDNMMGIYGSPAREGVSFSSVIRVAPSSSSRMAPIPGGPGPVDANALVTKLRWQHRIMGADVLSANSIVTSAPPQNTTRTAVDSPCDATSFPAEVRSQLGTMLVGENMIVGEVFFHYVPLYAQLLGGVTGATPQMTGGGFSMQEQTITRRLFLHPRLGDLVDLPPAHPVSAGPCPN